MKQFLIGCFKAYLLLEKKPVEILEFYTLIIRLLDLLAIVLIPGDGKQIRVQFCCETFSLRLLIALKQTLAVPKFAFPDNSILCIGRCTHINAKLSSCDHFIFPFLATIYLYT